jgi:tetratricopeptide (TPR) repeat protein/predicted Ser/Thr protein kinase
MFAPGMRLGHYEIEHVLGAGGMGTVYRALDGRLRRPVAIKFLHPGEQDDLSRRLLAEARSASALNHPNICTVYDVAEHGDLSFIVMEYIDGRPLGEMVAAALPATSLALDLARQSADALAHAHDRNVVHGDFKAANVLVSDTSRVKVVDFGLARVTAGTDVTETSPMGGTAYAMAPEQLRGAEADSRSDVWAFGVLLQALLSGTRPYHGTTLGSLIAAILSEPATPVPPHVDPAYRRIIERCLARDPRKRYQRASEVVAALEAVSHAEAVPRRNRSTTTLEIQPPPALTAVAASQIVLVGREEEWETLRAVWQRAAGGRRQLALVAGEAGIGKTRLVLEFARVVGREATILLGRCDPEALTPHQPFVEALDWYVRECPPGVIEAQLSEVDGVWELAQLIPALSRRVSLPPEPVESNPEGRRYRLFEAVAGLTEQISRTRPLLLVLEDLHWADRPTLLLLRHLLRSSHEGAIGIIATYRESELGRGHPLADFLAELRREDGVTRLNVSGLSEEQVRHFIKHWIGRDSPLALTRLVAGNTEGNPFFMSEVLRHLAETGTLASIDQHPGASGTAPLGVLPEGVRETISRRLARLGDDCNRALSLAAVIGREFTLPVLAEVARMSEDQLIDILEEALGARLIHEVPGVRDRYAFTHALVRDALYEQLTASRKARLHHQVAESLERLQPSHEQSLADLALHYASARTPADAQKAIEYAMGAAERAASGVALEEAARFYGVALQALDQLPADESSRRRRLDLHFRRGRAFADVGLWAPARTEFAAALPLVDAADVTQRTVILLELSKCSFWLLDVPAVRGYADEALALAESIARDDLVADAMSWLAGVLNAEGDVPSAVEMDRRAIARVGGAKTFGLSRTVISLYHLGRVDEAIERAREGLEGARVAQDPNFRVYALEQLALSLSAVGRYAEACRTFEEMRDFGRRHGVLPMLARGLAMFAGLHIALGDYQRGEELVLEARDLAQRIAFPPAFVSAGLDLLFIYARTHQPGRAEALIDEVSRSVTAASGWHGWLWRLRLSQARAELALARGDWDRVVIEATEGIESSTARSRPKYVALGLIARAEAQHAAGQQAPALADAARAVATARTLGDPAVLLKALTVHLKMGGDDTLADQVRECQDRILLHIDDDRLRDRFRSTIS